MLIKLDTERARAALANPAQSGLSKSDLAVLQVVLETAGDEGIVNIIDDTDPEVAAPKKKRKPRPRRIKRSKVK